MKKLAEIMDELGFDPHGSPAVKEAFVKYLIKASHGVSVLIPTEKELILANPDQVRPLPKLNSNLTTPSEHLHQLQFGFMSEPGLTSEKKPKSS
jgi:hypothetical protein